MLKLLSFVLLIVILIVLFFGINVANKKSLNDVHDIQTGYTIDNLYITETADDTGVFTGYTHLFYLFMKYPYDSEHYIIKRVDNDKSFEIYIDQHNVLTIKINTVSKTQNVEYLMPLGRWINIGVVVNEYAIELYINGTLLKTTINTMSNTTPDLYDTDITIGDSTKTGNSNNGWISSYKYFDKPLDAKTINDYYQENVNKYNNLKDEYGLRLTVDKNDEELLNYEF